MMNIYIPSKNNFFRKGTKVRIISSEGIIEFGKLEDEKPNKNLIKVRLKNGTSKWTHNSHVRPGWEIDDNVEYE